MGIRSAVSSNPDAEGALAELSQALGGMTPRLVVFFASSAHDPKALGSAVKKTFGSTPSIGCTTAGELGGGKMLKGSVSLIAFGEEDLRSAHIAVIGDMKSEASVSAGLASLSGALGKGIGALDPAKYVGLVLHDGMSGAEESVMAALSSATNVPFVGGSAGDDARFATTWVFADGQPSTGASVLALLEPARPFAILKTQSFDVTDGTLKVTDVDEATRTVRRFNGEPAAAEYAKVLGTAPAKLAESFMTHPLGLVLSSGEPFVRSPQQVKGSDVVFYCQVKEGQTLKVLRARNIVDDTKRDLDAAIGKLGGCSGILNFHCILRTLELEAKKQTEAYGALFTKAPTAGFSTYGESYIGHINQTSTMVLFA